MHYQPISFPIEQLVVDSKILCIAQCARRFSTCNIVVFDRGVSPQCILFNEPLVFANLASSVDSVVVDFGRLNASNSSCSAPVFVGNTSNIFSTSSQVSSYTCNYFKWISPNNGTVTLAFQFRHDPGKWYMDDVSVWDGTTEMLINGGFESGSFAPGWIKSTPYGICLSGSTSAQVNSSSCRTGSYCLTDGCSGLVDQISQSFLAVAGRSYFIIFWLTSGNVTNGTISTTVTLA